MTLLMNTTNDDLGSLCNKF